MAKMTKPRMLAGVSGPALAVVDQLERLEKTEVQIAQKRDADMAVLITEQQRTNYLLAGILVRLGGQP
jgi:hypothetical protein